MSIKDKEKTLFDEWSSGHENFVTDGVVSELDYISESRKICFVLKEINDEGGGGWDLCQFLSQGAQGYTWNNVARWSQGIKNLENRLNYEEVRDVTKENRIDWLKSICAMNMKKWPGSNTTIDSELAEYAKRDASFIKRQWELYDADITICCGTGDYFAEVIGLPLEPWPKSSSGVEYYEISPRKFVLHYGHPQPRGVFYKDMYDRLMSTIREVLHVNTMA